MSKDFDLFTKKDTKHFRVTVFGSARTKIDNATYKEVSKLAQMLGERGLDVVTGGGPGLMQAANEGHRLGNKIGRKRSHSIGIGIKLPWEQKFNKAVQYKKEYKVFSARLDQFMLLSNAVVVTPGGLGTLLELFYTWQLVQVHHICDIPIILMGDTWKGLLKWIKKETLAKGYIDNTDYSLIFHAKNPADAINII